MSNQETALARPLKIGPRTAENRFVIQPMECNDGLMNGYLSDLSYQRYEKLMRGQAGVVILESVTMQNESRARVQQLLIDVNDERNKESWRDFVKTMKSVNPNVLLIAQLNHSGELSESTFSERVCVKPLYGFGGKLMSESYVDDMMDLYVRTSRFLYECGFDGVDIKICHGYFISQLVRPYNDRNWKYGGSWENRSRFPFELTERIRKVVPDENFLIGAKVSMYEGQPGGQGHAGPDSPLIDLTESIKLIQGLEERGASFFIETLGSAGSSWALMTPNGNNAFEVYNHMTVADIMKKNLHPQTAVVTGGLSILGQGKIKEVKGVDPEWNSIFHWGNYLIEHGSTDMIAIGRQSLADPALPKKYLEDREEEINWCRCCDCCCKLEERQKETGCVVYNPYYAEVFRNSR